MTKAGLHRSDQALIPPQAHPLSPAQTYVPHLTPPYAMVTDFKSRYNESDNFYGDVCVLYGKQA